MWHTLKTDFKSVSEVCGWDEANKLKWLWVRLSGRAGQVFKRLPDATKADYGLVKAAMKSGFEPETQRTLYQTKLQIRMKQKGEGWAEFGEDLKH